MKTDVGKKTSFGLKKNAAPRRYFLVNESTPFAIREAYKSIRTNLLSVFSTNDDITKQICFTSPETGDGKTLNCANIAASFAEMGAKVLVVDADMRKPKLHRVFKVNPSPGLSDCLGGFCTAEKAIVPCNIARGVHILPAGKIPPNPTELILSDHFSELLRSFEGIYDYVFVDAPPAGVVTDATIISQKTLGAVLVCRSGHTRRDILRKAKDEIIQGGGRVLGALLNGVDFGKSAKHPKTDRSYDYYTQAYDDAFDDDE